MIGLVIQTTIPVYVIARTSTSNDVSAGQRLSSLFEMPAPVVTGEPFDSKNFTADKGRSTSLRDHCTHGNRGHRDHTSVRQVKSEALSHSRGFNTPTCHRCTDSIGTESRLNIVA